MKIYIAGKWEEHDVINKYATLLEDEGHTISFPWFRLHLGDTPYPQAASEDIDGVASAHACIFIFERELPYSGAMVELGAALALHKQVIIVGAAAQRTIFTSHPLVTRVHSFDEALELVSH
jgi:Nucleoside 2-deoxyribosyltransferase